MGDLHRAIWKAPKECGQGIKGRVAGGALRLCGYGVLKILQGVDAQVECEGDVAQEHVIAQEHPGKGVCPMPVVVETVGIVNKPQL